MIGLEERNSGAIYMMTENNTRDLKRLYQLFSRVPSCLESLREAMGEFVKSLGLQVIDQFSVQKDAVQFVKDMLDTKKKFEKIILTSFMGDKKASKSLKDAFDFFLNKGHSCASHLAAFMDDFLRGGLKGFSEHEVDGQLDDAISLFQHLLDKDIFENYYKQLLSKRLLAGKSISDDAEKAFLSKLNLIPFKSYACSL